MTIGHQIALGLSWDLCHSTFPTPSQSMVGHHVCWTMLLVAWRWSSLLGLQVHFDNNAVRLLWNGFLEPLCCRVSLVNRNYEIFAHCGFQSQIPATNDAVEYPLSTGGAAVRETRRWRHAPSRRLWVLLLVCIFRTEPWSLRTYPATPLDTKISTQCANLASSRWYDRRIWPHLAVLVLRACESNYQLTWSAGT